MVVLLSYSYIPYSFFFFFCTFTLFFFSESIAFLSPTSCLEFHLFSSPFLLFLCFRFSFFITSCCSFFFTPLLLVIDFIVCCFCRCFNFKIQCQSFCTNSAEQRSDFTSVIHQYIKRLTSQQ